MTILLILKWDFNIGLFCVIEVICLLMLFMIKLHGGEPTNTSEGINYRNPVEIECSWGLVLIMATKTVAL